MSESFCVFPWVHAFAGGNGGRQLCCIAEKELGDAEPHQNLQEYWNGDYLRDVRQKMLKGEKLSECSRCEYWEKSNSLGLSKRQEANKKFENEIINIRANTETDGTTSLKPFYFDYRSKTCNFKCRTCGPLNSSSIHQETLNDPELRQLNKGYEDPKFLSKLGALPKFRSDTLEAELLERASNKEITELYWAGGEPLLNPTHWKVMKTLVDNGHARNVSVEYNTNLSLDEATREEWFRMLGYFKAVNVRVSLDGTGKVGEYLRFGLDYELFLSNLEALKEFASRKHFNVLLDVVLTSLGLLDLPNLLVLSVKTRIPIFANRMYYSNQNSYLSAHFFPLKIQKQLIVEALEAIERLSRFDFKNFALVTSVHDLLTDMLENSLSIAEDTPESRSELLNHMRIYDRKRNASFAGFLESRPPISLWFSEYVGQRRIDVVQSL